MRGRTPYLPSDTSVVSTAAVAPFSVARWEAYEKSGLKEPFDYPFSGGSLLSGLGSLLLQLTNHISIGMNFLQVLTPWMVPSGPALAPSLLLLWVGRSC